MITCVNCYLQDVCLLRINILLVFINLVYSLHNIKMSIFSFYSSNIEFLTRLNVSGVICK